MLHKMPKFYSQQSKGRKNSLKHYKTELLNFTDPVPSNRSPEDSWYFSQEPESYNIKIKQLLKLK